MSRAGSLSRSVLLLTFAACARAEFIGLQADIYQAGYVAAYQAAFQVAYPGAFHAGFHTAQQLLPTVTTIPPTALSGGGIAGLGGPTTSTLPAQTQSQGNSQQQLPVQVEVTFDEQGRSGPGTARASPRRLSEEVPQASTSLEVDILAKRLAALEDANKDLKLQLASWQPEAAAIDPAAMTFATQPRARPAPPPPRPPQRRLADGDRPAAPAPAPGPGPAPSLPSATQPAAGPTAGDDYRARLQAAADRLAALENTANAALAAATGGAGTAPNAPVLTGKAYPPPAYPPPVYTEPQAAAAATPVQRATAAQPSVTAPQVAQTAVPNIAAGPAAQSPPLPAGPAPSPRRSSIPDTNLDGAQSEEASGTPTVQRIDKVNTGGGSSRDRVQRPDAVTQVAERVPAAPASPAPVVVPQPAAGDVAPQQQPASEVVGNGSKVRRQYVAPAPAPGPSMANLAQPLEAATQPAADAYLLDQTANPNAAETNTAADMGAGGAGGAASLPNVAVPATGGQAVSVGAAANQPASPMPPASPAPDSQSKVASEPDRAQQTVGVSNPAPVTTSSPASPAPASPATASPTPPAAPAPPAQRQRYFPSAPAPGPQPYAVETGNPEGGANLIDQDGQSADASSLGMGGADSGALASLGGNAGQGNSGLISSGGTSDGATGGGSPSAGSSTTPSVPASPTPASPTPASPTPAAPATSTSPPTSQQSTASTVFGSQSPAPPTASTQPTMGTSPYTGQASNPPPAPGTAAPTSGTTPSAPASPAPQAPATPSAPASPAPQAPAAPSAPASPTPQAPATPTVSAAQSTPSDTPARASQGAAASGNGASAPSSPAPASPAPPAKSTPGALQLAGSLDPGAGMPVVDQSGAVVPGVTLENVPVTTFAPAPGPQPATASALDTSDTDPGQGVSALDTSTADTSAATTDVGGNTGGLLNAGSSSGGGGGGTTTNSGTGGTQGSATSSTTSSDLYAQTTAQQEATALQALWEARMAALASSSTSNTASAPSGAATTTPTVGVTSNTRARQAREQLEIDVGGQTPLMLARSKAQSRVVKANTLHYVSGYAAMTMKHYAAVPHVQNKDLCASMCHHDERCAAWSRVAGGRRDVQTCYLYAGLTAVSPTANLKQPRFGAPRHPAVRYTPGEDALILESGTKDPDALPKALYGCPYKPSIANGFGLGCAPPAGCNCYNGACYGRC